MQNHLKTLFSSQALKAWVAGLMAVIAAYVIPALSEWITQLTPEAITAWFAGLGVEVPYAVAAVILGLVGVVWTYFTKNTPAAEQ